MQQLLYYNFITFIKLMKFVYNIKLNLLVFIVVLINREF